MRNKSGLLTLMTAIGSFLVVAALVLLVQFFVDRANTLEESVYSYPNSVWQCEEHDVRLVMDVQQVCYGMTESETLYVEFRYLQGRRAERDFEIYSSKNMTMREAVVTEKGQFDLSHQGRLENCDKRGFTIRLRRSDLPLWGITEPTVLHFTRKELPYDADFSDSNNPVFNEFDAQ